MNMIDSKLKYCLILLCMGNKNEIGCWGENGSGQRVPNFYTSESEAQLEIDDVNETFQIEVENDYCSKVEIPEEDDYIIGKMVEKNGIYTVHNLDGVKEFEYDLKNDEYNWD